jgi:AP-1 complex subunit gamma-1
VSVEDICIDFQEKTSPEEQQAAGKQQQREMSVKLRDLIRAVRACKTAAEERAVISKECALIRTAIKEENELFRHRNVAKLMYIHMLGYPTHFGQMECLKLISAQSFPEKRIGYLGLTLLLTENTEVLTLVTNSLKVDLTNSNQYIVALSLIAIGNLCTQDMARDLASDVDKLLRANNAYLRKKAALATIRLLKKEPDLIEHMSERIVGLLKDRAHGVLVTGIQLMTEVLEILPSMTEEYRRLVPSLVRLLRNFISMGYSPEHDVGGITDPFLQVALIRLLRYLGKGNEEASDQMNDVLAQVATNTETTKTAGNAILYECVMTIMDVESDTGLRVLAVNILGRFLLNRDNNIRYVALNTLSKVVNEDISAVQRHRATIVDCLKDSDISIRQRALELIFQLVNEQNVEALSSELLNYLVIAHSDHKASIVSRLMEVIEKYSPSKKWRVDTLITMLTLAGNQCDESIFRDAILFITQAESLQSYAVHQLYATILSDTSQITLVHVAIWCIGEYGDLLVRPCSEAGIDYPPIAESDIVTLLDSCLRLHNADITTKSYVLNALIKLTTRVSPAVRGRILTIMNSYRGSIVLELQQRGAEYSTLLSGQWEGLRGELLGKMPILDEATMKKKRGITDDLGSPTEILAPQVSHVPQQSFQNSAPAAAAKPAGGSFLLDLDDIFGGGSSHTAPLQPSPAANQPVYGNPPPQPAFQTNDLLADIFAPAPMAAPVTPQMTFGAPQSAPVAFSPPAPPANPTFKAFEKSGLSVTFELMKPNPSNPASTTILCKFANQTSSPISNLVFQVTSPAPPSSPVPHLTTYSRLLFQSS